MPVELSIAQFRVDDPHVELVRASGVVVRGARIADLLRDRPPGTAFIQHALRWDELLGPHEDLRVDREGVRAAVRRFFSWKQLVQSIANTLARTRRARMSDFEGLVNRWALEDSWPAGLANWSILISTFSSAGKRLTAVTEQGLLWLLADALAHPWQGAGEAMGFDNRRLLRLAMIAGGVMSKPIAPEAMHELLVPLGRLHSDDEALAVLVRCHELYCELLPEVFPKAVEAFERSEGISITQWIVDACRTFLVTRKWLRSREDGGATIDLRPDQPALPTDYERIYATARRLSASPEQFRAAYEGAPQDDVLGLRFGPLRRWPLLTGGDIGEHFFVVLHLDFLLSVADDGVFYRALDALDAADKERFLNSFGTIFERYVERVLKRTVSRMPHASFVRLDDGTARAGKRCDFGWRVGNDLVLVDAKRCGVTAAMVEGRETCRARLDEQVAQAASQFIETAADIEAGRLGVLGDQLGTAAGWRPARVFGLMVHHHPLFLWFESTRSVLERQGLMADWDRRFAAPPLAWSTSELELFEAAAPTFDVAALLSSIADGDEQTKTGLRGYLSAIGWQGFPVSPYFVEKRTTILGAPGA